MAGETPLEVGVSKVAMQLGSNMDYDSHDAIESALRYDADMARMQKIQMLQKVLQPDKSNDIITIASTNNLNSVGIENKLNKKDSCDDLSAVEKRNAKHNSQDDVFSISHRLENTSIDERHGENLPIRAPPPGPPPSKDAMHQASESIAFQQMQNTPDFLDNEDDSDQEKLKMTESHKWQKAEQKLEESLSFDLGQKERQQDNFHNRPLSARNYIKNAKRMLQYQALVNPKMELLATDGSFNSSNDDVTTNRYHSEDVIRGNKNYPPDLQLDERYADEQTQQSNDAKTKKHSLNIISSDSDDSSLDMEASPLTRTRKTLQRERHQLEKWKLGKARERAKDFQTHEHPHENKIPKKDAIQQSENIYEQMNNSRKVIDREINILGGIEAMNALSGSVNEITIPQKPSMQTQEQSESTVEKISDHTASSSIAQDASTVESSELPPGWVTLEDQYGQEYYFHEQSCHSQWEHPLEHPQYHHDQQHSEFHTRENDNNIYKSNIEYTDSGNEINAMHQMWLQQPIHTNNEAHESNNSLSNAQLEGDIAPTLVKEKTNADSIKGGTTSTNNHSTSSSGTDSDMSDMSELSGLSDDELESIALGHTTGKSSWSHAFFTNAATSFAKGAAGKVKNIIGQIRRKVKVLCFMLHTLLPMFMCFAIHLSNQYCCLPIFTKVNDVKINQQKNKPIKANLGQSGNPMEYSNVLKRWVPKKLVKALEEEHRKQHNDFKDEKETYEELETNSDEVRNGAVELIDDDSNAKQRKKTSIAGPNSSVSKTRLKRLHTARLLGEQISDSEDMAFSPLYSPPRHLTLPNVAASGGRDRSDSKQVRKMKKSI